MSRRMTQAALHQANPEGERAPISVVMPDLEGATAQEVLAYGVKHFHPRLTLACSFQKEESVLFHMLSEIEPGRTRSRSTPAFCSLRRWRRGSGSRIAYR